MDLGFVSVDFQELQLCVKSNSSQQFSIKLEAELIDCDDKLIWKKTGKSSFGSGSYASEERENISEDDEANAQEKEKKEEKDGMEENEAEAEKEVVPKKYYYVGFDSLNLRSKFIDLNDEMMTVLANGKLSVKVLDSNKELFNMSFPFSSLLESTTGIVNVAEYLDQFSGEYSPIDVDVKDERVCLEKTSIVYSINADYDLTNFFQKSRILSWNTGTLIAPASWGLHAPDVVDPKAKATPTSEELRQKYIENIKNKVEGQDNIASYTLSIEGNDYIPSQTFVGGKVSFNEELAKEIDVEEDIRARNDLWTVNWDDSKAIYISQSNGRKFVADLRKEEKSIPLSVTIKKVPGEAGVDEGAEQSISGIINITCPNGSRKMAAKCTSLTGDGFEESAESNTFSICLHTNTPFLPPKKPLLFELEEKEVVKQEGEGGINVPLAVNTDVNLEEVEEEIGFDEAEKELILSLNKAIEGAVDQIACEYSALFPNVKRIPSSVETNQSSTEDFESLKNHLNDLETFKALEEQLKAELQKLSQMRSNSVMGRDSSQQVSPEQLIKEEMFYFTDLYSKLIEQLKINLNKRLNVFLQSRNASELNKYRKINGKNVHKAHEFKQLLSQAIDCAADDRFTVAEDIHLERIELIKNNYQDMNITENQGLHDAYSAYAISLLTNIVNKIKKSALSSFNFRSLLKRALDVLEVAYSTDESNADIAFLFGCSLFEYSVATSILSPEEDIQSRAESVIIKSISTSLPSFQLESLNGLSDYDESDILSGQYAVNPMYFVMLGVILSLKNEKVKSRRAFHIAKALSNEDLDSNLLSRKVVLLLSEASIYAFDHGFRTLGKECVKLAEECEAGISDRASERNKAVKTAPHVKYMLLRAQAIADVVAGEAESTIGSESIRKAEKAELVAETDIDKVRAWIAVNTTLKKFMNELDGDQLTNSYLQIVCWASKLDPKTLKDEKVVPLFIFIETGKLLLQKGRYQDATNTLLFASSIYSSSVLFLLLGISYLRRNELVDAETAFLEGNFLDNRNPLVWSYLSVICLVTGSYRVAESERCFEQALRFHISDIKVLEELASLFFNMSKFDVAEAITRRIINLCSNNDAMESQLDTSNYTLAQILAEKNKAEKAIELFKDLISKSSTQNEIKVQAAFQCSRLLDYLGREEELKTVNNIMTQI